MAMKRRGSQSPQREKAEEPFQFAPLENLRDGPFLRPYNTQQLHGFPTDSKVSKLGSTMQSRFKNGLNLYPMGSTCEEGELHHVWVALSCYDLHKRLDGVIDVKVSTGEVFVRTENDEDLFYATLGDINPRAAHNVRLFFNDKTTEFGSIINQSLHDHYCKDDKFTIQMWDKPHGVDVLVNRKLWKAPTIRERFTIDRLSPTRLICKMDANILEPTWKALGLMLTLKAAYSLYQLHRLPQPASLLFRQPQNNIIPETTPSIMGYMLATMKEVRIRAAMRNCQSEVWMDLMSEKSEILLTMHYELPEEWGAAEQTLRFKDNYGVAQIIATGLGENDRMDVVAGWKVNEQEHKYGYIQPDSNVRGDIFYDSSGQAVMYEQNFVKATNLKVYNEPAHDEHSPGKKLFLDVNSGPFNYDILSPRRHEKLAEVKVEEATALITFVTSESLENDWKALILAQAWRRAHHDYVLFRLSPYMCNKQYGWRLAKVKGAPIPTDWSGVTRLAEKMKRTL